MIYMKNLIMFIAFILATGCAGVINGTDQDMTFRSDPEGATIMVDGLERGKTPLTISLKKSQYKTVTFKKDGYKDQSIELTKEMDTVAFLNIFWDLSTTDAMTGALYEYKPGMYHITMQKSN